MLIGTKYKIESPLNVILSKKGKTKEGEEKWTGIGYYSSVKSALHGLVEIEVKATELKDLKTIVAKIDELHKLIEGLEV